MTNICPSKLEAWHVGRTEIPPSDPKYRHDSA
jgi:hypothetical protein